MFKKIFLFFLFFLFSTELNAQTDIVATSTVATSTVATSTEMTIEDTLIREEISVTPTIIDERLELKGISTHTIKIKNNSSRKIDLYPTVNDILEDQGKQEFKDLSKMDRKTSLASWISFKRGVVELEPSQEISLPLEVKVAIDAIPGKYYASLAFPQGSDRISAQASMLSKNFAQVIINLNLEEVVLEKAQIKNFLTSKNIFFDNNIDFKIELANIGNNSIDPAGAIYIFSRQGAEVDKIEIAKGEYQIGTDNKLDIIKKVSQNIGYGKFKARLELEYGNKCIRDLQDTLFFWVLPWKFLLGFLGVFITIIVLTFVVIKMRK